MAIQIPKLTLMACVGVAVGCGCPGTLIAQPFPGVGGEVQRASYEAPVASSGHPMAPVLKWAGETAANIENGIADYSATVVSRERSGGKLSDFESVFIKIRHRPFSIYAYVLTPDDHKGDEAIFVEGRNDGKLQGHTTGIMGKLVGTVSLDPASPLAMEGQHHPITELGTLAMCQRVIRFARSDLRYAESQVQFLSGATVNGRPCTCIEMIHPVPRTTFAFHVVRVFVDEQLKVPIRYEQYDWPKEPGAAPVLVEEYTYLNLKLNNGFTDADFDPRNRRYGFP